MDAAPSSTKPKLQDKVTVITGGASGIGEATARLFAAHGARAVVIADVDDEKGREVAASIAPPARCTYVRCNVTDEAQVEALVRSTVHLYGRLDVMFANAGMLSRLDQNILDLDLGAMEALFAVNVRGVAASVKHAARAMTAGGVSGSIVCTASVAATSGIVGSAVDYMMSKHAVVGVVRAASAQLGAQGVRVNCVSPSHVATPMLCGATGMDAGDVERVYEACYGLKGVLKAKHVAEAVVFLASDDSEFVTGHNLVVDGGYRAVPDREVGLTNNPPAH